VNEQHWTVLGNTGVFGEIVLDLMSRTAAASAHAAPSVAAPAPLLSAAVPVAAAEDTKRLLLLESVELTPAQPSTSFPVPGLPLLQLTILPRGSSSAGALLSLLRVSLAAADGSQAQSIPLQAAGGSEAGPAMLAAQFTSAVAGGQQESLFVSADVEQGPALRFSLALCTFSAELPLLSVSLSPRFVLADSTFTVAATIVPALPWSQQARLFATVSVSDGSGRSVALLTSAELAPSAEVGVFTLSVVATRDQLSSLSAGLPAVIRCTVRGSGQAAGAAWSQAATASVPLSVSQTLLSRAPGSCSPAATAASEAGRSLRFNVVVAANAVGAQPVFVSAELVSEEGSLVATRVSAAAVPADAAGSTYIMQFEPSVLEVCFVRGG
jgi:hypothetical protein